ncbi:hypothetical protein [Spiroplasma endosymbiont of Lasioglossum malachurum]|uniref:hypothetical protein n=1 Tax=Spiroplasma endosymbiont of Lasioglossum malachurum TaxID=3066319 RepID=UPI0030CA7E66
MKNIKTLFKLMTAVILTTVSTGSLIACQSDDILKMNMQVQKDFNFLDSNNNSTIKLDIYQNNITKKLYSTKQYYCQQFIRKW